ncbi:LPS assembly protein LptD [Pseudomonadota bacterium]
MPGQLRILTVAISSLLVVSAALPLYAASPTWECRTAADGASWECFKGGVLVADPAPVQDVSPAVITKEAPSVPDKPTVSEAKSQEPTLTPATKPAPVVPSKLDAKAAVAEQQAEKPTPAPPAQKSDKEEAKPEQNTVVAASTVDAVEQAAVPRLDRGLDWNQCRLSQFRMAAEPKDISPDDGRTYINADAAEIAQNDEVGTFTGNVDVTRGGSLLSADEVQHDNKNDLLNASGNVYYQDSSLRIEGEKAQFNLAVDQGYIEPAEYRLPAAMARGTATRAEQVNKDQAHFDNIEYTTCRPGDNSWVLRAKTMDTDQVSGRGEATHVRVALGGVVPIFYSPYISFPIDDRRKTGFLAPSIGKTDETGTDISIPYYLNLAPNYDATITPRSMSRRGLMLAGEFRFLTKNHGGVVTGEIIPDDDRAPENVGSTRGVLSIKERGQLAQNLILDMDINHVSDDEYLDDFGGSLAASAGRQMERRADVTYHGSDWSIKGRIQHFQSTDQALAPTSEAYRRLPQIKFSLERPDQPFGLTYHLDAEYVQFDHRAKVEGHRYDLHGGLSMPILRPWGFFTPKVTARFTGYSLDNQSVGDPDDPERFIPTLSIDGGLFFDRETNWFGSAIVQTLEPRAFYLAIPHKNQDDQPNFDTSGNGISFPNLFRENRFNGADRVGDANQLTLALTSRIIQDATGKELFSASVGSIFYFRDRKVQLSRNAAYDEDSTSAIVAEATARLADAWTARATGEWDPHRDERNTTQISYQLNYLDDEQRIFNIAHRYNRDVSEQTEMSTRWPITSHLSLVGRWQYSLLHNRTMEGFGGFEYDGCCYVVRVVGRRYVNEIDDEKANEAVFVQLELKGLSSFGSDIVTLLDEGIFGYSYDN